MKAALAGALALIFVLSGCTISSSPEPPPPPTLTSSPAAPTSPAIKLPEPQFSSDISLEESLQGRRSVREYSGDALSLAEVSHLLWAGQGITSEAGGRTAPSAGGLYPLELYLVAGSVDGLSPGVYRYKPQSHELTAVKQQDVRKELAEAAVSQEWVEKGAVVVAITAIYERTTVKYGDRGIRYVHLEAGHAAQNICLEAAALDLGAVTVGAFFDDRVRDILGASSDETPLYLIPVGKKR